MGIRRAEPGDIEGILKLLRQVCQIHADGRPDLFRAGGVKYTREDLLSLLRDDARPVYVFAGEQGEVLGYAFCVFEQTEATTSLLPVKTLYLDDLCVDESARGQHIGKQLYDRVLEVARAAGCDRVTLHAWNFNQQAFGFYEKLGLTPLVTTMEQKL